MIVVMNQLSDKDKFPDTSNKNIVIHGSCITRDIFRIHPEGFNIVDYFARSCLTSIVSTPLNIDEENLPGLTSKFQKRMVINDFKKNLFEQIEKFDFDYFLIDFIDERFNLLQAGTSYITKSAEFMNSKYLENTSVDFTEIRRLNYPFDLWKLDCNKYINRLTQVVPAEKIVIIKGKWAEKYQDASGNIMEFNGINHFRIEFISKMNALLDNYFGHICNQLPQLHCISYPLAIAQEKHEWGLSPFHYLTEQYDNIYEDLYQFTHKNITTPIL